jgi:hypothetical protein
MELLSDLKRLKVADRLVLGILKSCSCPNPGSLGILRGYNFAELLCINSLEENLHGSRILKLSRQILYYMRLLRKAMKIWTFTSYLTALSPLRRTSNVGVELCLLLITIPLVWG